MNIREEILREHSKAQALLIRDYIGGDPTLFADLVDLFLHDEYRVVQRAGWVISHCADQYPDLVVPHLPKFIEYAEDPPHVAVKRNVVRVMQFCQLPEDVEGLAYDLCWKFARSTKEDIAVRAHSLTVLGRIAEKYPELIDEVLTLASDFKQSESAGLKSRGRRISAKLEKAKKKREI